jgi:hypothetical protein
MILAYDIECFSKPTFTVGLCSTNSKWYYFRTGTSTHFAHCTQYHSFQCTTYYEFAFSRVLRLQCTYSTTQVLLLVVPFSQLMLSGKVVCLHVVRRTVIVPILHSPHHGVRHLDFSQNE